MDQQQTEPRTFFLNEQHELRGEKAGRGAFPKYTGIDWAVKGKRLHGSLQTASAKVKRSHDPLREKRYYLLAKPESQVNKLSENKKTGQTKTVPDKTDYSRKHVRVFGRLGIDLIEVTDEGDAVIHATPERFTQLSTEATALRSITRSDAHRSYPLIDRLYDLKRLSSETEVTGDTWVLELNYKDVADYSPGIDFTPQQRVAFAAELFDEAGVPVSPQAFLQALPIAATLSRLSIPPVTVRSPVIIKTRV